MLFIVQIIKIKTKHLFYFFLSKVSLLCPNIDMLTTETRGKLRCMSRGMSLYTQGQRWPELGCNPIWSDPRFWGWFVRPSPPRPPSRSRISRKFYLHYWLDDRNTVTPHFNTPLSTDKIQKWETHYYYILFFKS